MDTFQWFVNLTPHDINVVKTDGTVFSIPKSGDVARCAQSRQDVGVVDGINISTTKFGDVQDLPDPEIGVWFIVSALVRGAVPHRKDVLSPGTLVRDDAGNVIGCQGFDVNP